MSNFKLDSEPKINSGFSVPDHYFDSFSAKLMPELSKKKPKVISFWAKTKTRLFAVAAILILALSLPTMSVLKTKSSELDSVTLENYLTNHNAVSNEVLAELLDEADIEKMKVDYGIENKAIEDLLSTNSNLEEYLLN